MLIWWLSILRHYWTLTQNYQHRHQNHHYFLHHRQSYSGHNLWITDHHSADNHTDNSSPYPINFQVPKKNVFSEQRSHSTCFGDFFSRPPSRFCPSILWRLEVEALTWAGLFGGVGPLTLLLPSMSSRPMLSARNSMTIIIIFLRHYWWEEISSSSSSIELRSEMCWCYCDSKLNRFDRKMTPSRCGIVFVTPFCDLWPQDLNHDGLHLPRFLDENPGSST